MQLRRDNKLLVFPSCRFIRQFRFCAVYAAVLPRDAPRQFVKFATPPFAGDPESHHSTLSWRGLDAGAGQRRGE